MPPALLRVLCALCALCVLCAVCAPSGDTNATVGPYCSQLRNLALVPENRTGLALSERGAARRLRLAGGGGAAARAAHELLRALLVHALRYRHDDVHLDDHSTLADLAAIDDHDHRGEFILSVASAWGDEHANDLTCATRVCGVAGTRLSVLARDAAPVARRLLARLAAGANATCLRSWDALRAAHCGFLHAEHEQPAATPNRSCELNLNYSSGAEYVTVVLGAQENETGECMRARTLQDHAGSLPLRFEWLPDAELRAKLDNSNRSFLFVDYDLWGDGAGEGVLPATPLTSTKPPTPVSLVVADARKLTLYAPAVLQLALRFRPSPGLLRRQLADRATLDPREAACKAAADNRDVVTEWFKCDNHTCDPTIHDIRVYLCGGKNNYYQELATGVFNYWKSNFSTGNSSPNLRLYVTNCSYVNELNENVEAVLMNLTSRARLTGVAAMGDAGASPLPQTLRQQHVPLLVVTPETARAPLGAGARSTAPALAALADAVGQLRTQCGWKRVALLREEGTCVEQKRSLGLGEMLSDLRQLVVSEQGVEQAVEELLALDARVVVVDASARTAGGVLRAAQRRALTPAAGYMWLVLGAATNHSDDDEDWWPEEAAFSYVTVGGAWRGGRGGGAVPAGLGGAARLRGALSAVAARAGRRAWSPQAAPLADAILLLLEGTNRVRRAHPQWRHDSQHPHYARLFFDVLSNISGVTHDGSGNVSLPVFAHRWSAKGDVELVGVWDAPGVSASVLPSPCGGVRDGAVCHTLRIGSDQFTAHCLDAVLAVLACVLALGPPALFVAHGARRRRLRLRDRRVEERVLLRGGHSAETAAAVAALAEHVVPRGALRLLDELGGGHYGVVRRAVLRRTGGPALAVAAKAPRADAPAGAATELLREAALLASLRHEHVVRFTGVCLEGGPLVLMDHAFHGDLRRYLRARRPLAERARAGLAEPEAEHVAAPALTRLAREAAAALGYLERRRLVHRDVRAANCLVDERRSLKLADFGMTRQLGESSAGEYLCRRRAMFPVLWMAPESLARGVFTPATDVWALGVLVLELATLGERPFGAWAAPRVLKHVRAGGAPPLPRDAAASTRGVVAACWQRAADERPTAAQLVAYLAEHPRAVLPALELLPGTDADADAGAGTHPDLDTHVDDAPTTPDSGLCMDEWT